MSLDPSTDALLKGIAEQNGPALHEMPVDTCREVFLQLVQNLQGDVLDIHKTEDRQIDGPNGPITLRISTPRDTGADKLPVLVQFHGGGWVIGDLDTHDNMCRYFANESDVIVVAVDYRLAPEAPFPAGLEDCYAATAWAADNAGELGAVGKPLAVAGDSAGGNLAAAVCLLARERGGPGICHQVLVYPVTDSDFDRSSYAENADGYVLTRDMMRWFWGHYLPEGVDLKTPLAAPLHADLGGLPDGPVARDWREDPFVRGPVTPPTISLTGRPCWAKRSAPRVDPLQCGPEQ